MNSLVNKLQYVFNVALSNNLHVLSITETWLTSDCASSFVKLPDYEFYRGDVVGGVRKHGAGLYVLGSLRQVQVDVDISNVVAVHLPDYDLYVLSVYRPPSYSDQENDLLMRFLRNFVVSRELIVLGDFNLPSLVWPLDGNGFSGVGVSPVDGLFLECFLECGLTQWVEFATFFRLVTLWILY